MSSDELYRISAFSVKAYCLTLTGFCIPTLYEKRMFVDMSSLSN